MTGSSCVWKQNMDVLSSKQGPLRARYMDNGEVRSGVSQRRYPAHQELFPLANIIGCTKPELTISGSTTFILQRPFRTQTRYKSRLRTRTMMRFRMNTQSLDSSHSKLILAPLRQIDIPHVSCAERLHLHNAFNAILHCLQG